MLIYREPVTFHSHRRLTGNKLFSIPVKLPNMKLPKTLLSAILLGIAVQTTTSCGKDKLPDPKKQEASDDKKKTVDPCPACGMG